MNRLNRRSDRWPDGTGRFQSNRTVQFKPGSLVYKLKYFGQNYAGPCLIMTKPTPYPTTQWADSWAQPPDEIIPWPSKRMPFIGILCTLIPLTIRCGIANQPNEWKKNNKSLQEDLNLDPKFYGYHRTPLGYTLQLCNMPNKIIYIGF